MASDPSDRKPHKQSQVINQVQSEVSDKLAGKYLTFRLGEEEFGVEILKVREIIGLMDITIVPRTPSSIRGVINLRGKIIPVVDLRAKFEIPRTKDTELTCIIVVDLQPGDRPTQMGILVDAVSEMLDIPVDQIEPTPAFGLGINTQAIRGMARCDNNVKILLNIEHVLQNTDAEETSTELAKDDIAENADPSNSSANELAA